MSHRAAGQGRQGDHGGTQGTEAAQGTSLGSTRRRRRAVEQGGAPQKKARGPYQAQAEDGTTDTMLRYRSLLAKIWNILKVDESQTSAGTTVTRVQDADKASDEALLRRCTELARREIPLLGSKADAMVKLLHHALYASGLDSVLFPTDAEPSLISILRHIGQLREKECLRTLAEAADTLWAMSDLRGEIRRRKREATGVDPQMRERVLRDLKEIRELRGFLEEKWPGGGEVQAFPLTVIFQRLESKTSELRASLCEAQDEIKGKAATHARLRNQEREAARLDADQQRAMQEQIERLQKQLRASDIETKVIRTQKDQFRGKLASLITPEDTTWIFTDDQAEADERIINSLQKGVKAKKELERAHSTIRKLNAKLSRALKGGQALEIED